MRQATEWHECWTWRAKSRRREWSQGESQPGSATDVTTTSVAELAPLVASALRRLNDLPALSRHRLVGLVNEFTAGNAALDGAAHLRTELVQAIERLRPHDDPPPRPGTSAGPGRWLHYLVLREAYVDGRPNRDIMQPYWIGEGTFYRARSNAINTVALDFAQHRGETSCARVSDRAYFTANQRAITRCWGSWIVWKLPGGRVSLGGVGPLRCGGVFRSGRGSLLRTSSCRVGAVGAHETVSRARYSCGVTLPTAASACRSDRYSGARYCCEDTPWGGVAPGRYSA